jgi:hypothetical protein
VERLLLLLADTIGPPCGSDDIGESVAQLARPTISIARNRTRVTGVAFMTCIPPLLGRQEALQFPTLTVENLRILDFGFWILDLIFKSVGRRALPSDFGFGFAFQQSKIQNPKSKIP